ncbi:hypothetical protein G6F59_018301 [Rhizopus arrhizus]|nr:hypothetical protein G6F59_018301 [Rhizopus arrhizus]
MFRYCADRSWSRRPAYAHSVCNPNPHLSRRRAAARACPRPAPPVLGMACDQRAARRSSTDRPIARIRRSAPLLPAIISPTGAVPCAWHGSDRAQPSRKLISVGLRRIRPLAA